jgi:AcrR family transcriptional regulator
MPVEQPTRLSRDRILDAARRVVTKDGLDALSMRRLAQELDVWPMSIYRYFRDKEELLDAVAATLAGTLRTPSADRPWREQLRDLLDQVRAAMAAETGGRLPRAFLTPELLRFSELGLTILRGAGFSADGAASAWRAVWSYTYGFATFALAPTEAEARRRARSALAALPAEDYPALTGAADEVAEAFSSDREFARGLDRLLEAFAP